MPDYEVSITCKDLADKDLFSKSDPVLILLENVPNSKRFIEVGKTELIKDCLNPQFSRKFRLSAAQDQNPKLRVAVVDIDNFEDVEKIADQEFIGRADFHLSDLVTSPMFTASLGRDCGLVTLKTSPYDAQLDGLVSMEIGSGSDPDGLLKGGSNFLEIHRADHAATLADVGRVCSSAYSLAHRTDQLQGADFRLADLSLFTLCRGDPHRLLRLECWRRGSRGSHRLLASGHTSLEELRQLAEAGGDGVELADQRGRTLRLTVRAVSVSPYKG
ncbi:hypothetical protein BOX15_Mlig004994g1 [Macrostomum lignano]|uniref:Uncharacterized protein n=2 Tax=Macrostomum lignano TaxID=282301 RepID=A0A267GRK6_9PLAT|nr:hypothetical protein BOX15_Mlig004994g1 [Macrostomum lignano]